MCLDYFNLIWLLSEHSHGLQKHEILVIFGKYVDNSIAAPKLQSYRFSAYLLQAQAVQVALFDEEIKTFLYLKNYRE